MAFFKPKEEENKSSLPELPELPQMPSLPELPKLPERSEVKPLPTFPRTSAGESQGLGMIKSTISSPSEKRTIELTDISSSQRPSLMSSAKEPVFVKLDKFQDAVRKFEEIKTKVGEIEDSLIKIREIKDKEEQELKAWEQEMQIIKEKVNTIDSSLFSKI